MKKPKLKLYFDSKYLDKLANDEGSCVHAVRSPYHLALHPFQLNDLTASVKEILNKGIAKYSRELDGILFGYSNIKFLSKRGQIIHDSCYIHVDIEANFYIFKPIVGQTLQGVVKKKSEDHVGCLVHEIFNVSLPKPKRGDDWIGNSIRLNSELLLLVTHTDFGGKLPYIKGKIESVLSEPEVDLSQSETLNNSETHEKKKSKTNKKIRFDDNSEVISEIENEESSNKKRKKSKKSDISTEEVESPKKKRKKSEISDTATEDVEPLKKKSKKSKKSDTTSDQE